MNPRIIYALFIRYISLYTKNKIRLIELFFWPFMGLLAWGFLSLFIEQQSSEEFPYFLRFLIGALIFWDVLFRAQQGVAISFLEDVWTKNLLNVFVAPVRISEYLLALCLMGVARVAFTGLLLCVLSWFLFAFNILIFNWTLLPFFLNLIFFGWTLGIISIAMILRWGQAAESLAWAVPFIIQPFAAVFYPVSIYPDFIQKIAWLIPCTPIFEGMRSVIQTGETPWSQLFLGMGVNIVWFVLACLLFWRVFETARDKGLLTKLATQ